MWWAVLCVVAANATSPSRAPSPSEEAGLITSLVATQAAIAALGWGQTILSLNRYRGLRRVTGAEWFALAVQMASGGVRVVAAMATASSSFALQLTAATVGALSWSAFLIIYNDAVRPSCQQAQSVALGLVSPRCGITGGSSCRSRARDGAPVPPSFFRHRTERRPG